jgi:hypothetical protein
MKRVVMVTFAGLARLHPTYRSRRAPNPAHTFIAAPLPSLATMRDDIQCDDLRLLVPEQPESPFGDLRSTNEVFRGDGSIAEVERRVFGAWVLGDEHLPTGLALCMAVISRGRTHQAVACFHAGSIGRWRVEPEGRRGTPTAWIRRL